MTDFSTGLMNGQIIERESTHRTEAKNRRLLRLKARRRWWLSLHLWLGLILGLLLSIYGITGSVLVFHEEVNEWLHSEALRVEPPAPEASYKPLSDIVAAGRKAMSENAQHAFTTYPRNAKVAFRLRYFVPKGRGVRETWWVAVDPYTAEVTGKQLKFRSDCFWSGDIISFIFRLHFALLIISPVASSIIVGLSGILLVISVLTGLIVWWPLTHRWRQALTMKWKAGGVRMNYDLHKLSGFYTTLVMIPVLFSGVYMVRPQNVVPVLELFSPVTYRYWFKSTPPFEYAEPIGTEQAVNIALQHYPSGRPHFIYDAFRPTRPYTVCQNGVNAPGSWLQRRCTVIDRYSGKILDLDDPSLPTATAGEIFTHWQWPLHSGQAFGMTGRILVFLTGLACPILFVTGVIRWLQKRRAKQATGKRLR